MTHTIDLPSRVNSKEVLADYKGRGLREDELHVFRAFWQDKLEELLGNSDPLDTRRAEREEVMQVIAGINLME